MNDESKNVTVITSRLGPMPCSLALALLDAGWIPLIINMRSAEPRRSLRTVLANFGLGYVVKRAADFILFKVWLRVNSRRLSEVRIVDLDKSRWDEIFALKESSQLLVCSSLRFKVPSKLINTRTPVLNLHPAPLPGWRGPDPIYWMRKRHERRYGVSLHEVTEAFDEGDVYFQKDVRVRMPITNGCVELALSRLVKRYAAQWAESISSGTARPNRQGEGRYWPLPSKKNVRRLRSAV